MDDFILEGTEIIPSINFNAKSGLLKISGRMVSVSAIEYSYFDPLLLWVKEYSSRPAKQTRLEFDMEYCSSGGIMIISRILNIFKEMYQNGYDVSASWYYLEDDEETEEKGHEFKDLYKFPFDVLPHL